MQGIDTSIDPSLPLDNRLRRSELHFLMSIFAKNLTKVHNTVTPFSLSDTGGGRIASSVIVMQAGSVFEDIAGRVLKLGAFADPYYPAHVRPTRHFHPLSVAPNLNPGCDNTHLSQADPPRIRVSRSTSLLARAWGRGGSVGGAERGVVDASHL